MQITFIGVGEACDPLLPNTSILVDSGETRLLLDCGFTTAHLFLGYCPQADDLDLVWISHFHGDHFFGLPLLLLQYKVLGRTQELIIAGPTGIADKVTAALDLSYPGVGQRLGFALRFVELEPDRELVAGELALTTAANIHSQTSLSLRVSGQEYSLVYSGDGKPTPASFALARHVDLLIHESFWLTRQDQHHGNVADCLAHAGAAGVKELALVHMAATERHDPQCQASLRKMLAGQPFVVTVPLPGEKRLCP